MLSQSADSPGMTSTYGFEANELRSALQQQHEEARMLRTLGQSMGVEFHPKSLPLPGGGVMEIDGYSSKANAICEVCSSNGHLSLQEQEMLLMNAFKLRYAAQTLGNTVRQILLFRNRDAAEDFCGNRQVLEEMDGVPLEICLITPATA
jgi:hypothetical protein